MGCDGSWALRRRPKSTAILGEELRHWLGEQGWDDEGSENVTHLPGVVKEKRFMWCQGGGKEE